MFLVTASVWPAFIFKVLSFVMGNNVIKVFVSFVSTFGLFLYFKIGLIKEFRTIFNHDYAFELTGAWAVALLIFLIVIHKLKKNRTYPKLIIRKFFHFLILGIILSGMISEVFLKKVLSIVFFCFVNMEFIRCTLRKSIPLVNMVHDYMKNYTDVRDSDDLIATHIYLLFG